MEVSAFSEFSLPYVFTYTTDGAEVVDLTPLAEDRTLVAVAVTEEEAGAQDTEVGERSKDFLSCWNISLQVQWTLACYVCICSEIGRITLLTSTYSYTNISFEFAFFD